MNIIEAFQAAENGALITNGFLKRIDHFLKYMGNGVFYQYQVINGKHEYKYPHRDFSFSDITSISWEIVENNFFKK